MPYKLPTINYHLAKIQYGREEHILGCNLSCAKLRMNKGCKCNCHTGQKTIDSQDLYNIPK